jgi:hypothetical protein
MNFLQSTTSVLMVRPTSFGFNEQTAATNTFQNHTNLSAKELHHQANQEFDSMVSNLRSNGIHVTVFEDTDALRKPDAVFPNNWFSTWPNGQVYLYPMATESRRVERSYMAIHALAQDFSVTQVTDISGVEHHGFALESTGVIIFDHENKIAYGCVSPRCDASLFTSHVLGLGYEPVLFHAYGADGTAVYHTNVLMGVQSTTAVICAEAIIEEKERRCVLETLKNTGHDVVEITQQQMASFCGNVLELCNESGERFLAMSQTAYDNFTDEQHIRLGKDKILLPCDVTTIETIGGGSVRCMLGEVFLPRKTDIKQLVGEVLQATNDTVAI